MSVYLGIDWSQSKHDAAFLNHASACLAQLTISHTPEGFLKLDETRIRLGIEPSDYVVGRETAHAILAQGNVLVDFLWGRGYGQIYVVPPKVVKSNRSRYRQSGAQSDPGDAQVLADVLRTDCGRLYPWFPDSLLTRQIRATVSLIGFLTRTIGALSNRLRSVLFRYHPAALEVFSNLTSTITLAFIQAYPTPDEAGKLTWGKFQVFGRAHHYPSSRNLARAFARLIVEDPCQGAEASISEEPGASIPHMRSNPGGRRDLCGGCWATGSPAALAGPPIFSRGGIDKHSLCTMKYARACTRYHHELRTISSGG